MKKIPEKYKSLSLYYHCASCKISVQNENRKCNLKDVKVKNCPNAKYQSRLYNPVTQKIGKVKTHGNNLDEAITKNQVLIDQYKKSGYEIITRKEKKYSPLLIHWVAEYINFIKGIGVPESQQKNIKEKTINDSVRYLKNFLKALKTKYNINNIYASAITDEHTSIFFDWLKDQRNRSGEPLSASAWNKNINTNKYLFDFITEKGKYNIPNPFANIKKKSIQTDPISMSDTEIQKLLSAITQENGKGPKGKKNTYMTDYYYPELKEFFLAAVLIGARLSEMLSIRCSDVFLERYIIRIPLSDKSTKIYDYMPITPEMAELLHQIKYEPDSDNYLFFPERLNRSSWSQRISHCFTHFKRKAGLNEKFTFHTFRKTWVTKMFGIIGEDALNMKHGKEVALKHYFDNEKVAQKYKDVRLLNFNV